ncbi:hypothetical protein PM082_011705 [Marasmius tenuissimus]|nr:hypothetical protein PM082_011705 [Marasmius tenuissimus]
MAVPDCGRSVDLVWVLLRRGLMPCSGFSLFNIRPQKSGVLPMLKQERDEAIGSASTCRRRLVEGAVNFSHVEGNGHIFLDSSFEDLGCASSLGSVQLCAAGGEGWWQELRYRGDP